MTAASMAATPDPLQQRYEAIERVYSERQWDDVARLSEELLLELPNDPGHPLRQRLQLLLGHTYLYGYQDVATASGFYSRVQAATKEPVLLDIAAQGLEHCASQTATAPTPQSAAVEATPASSGGQAFPFGAEAVNPAPAGTGAVPAMPWMAQLGGTVPAAATIATTTPAELSAAEPTAVAQPPAVAEPPSVAQPMPEMVVVDVIDEPELIEVAQANPSTAQELDVAVNAEKPAEPVNSLSPEEIAELSKGLLRVVIR